MSAHPMAPLRATFSGHTNVAGFTANAGAVLVVGGGAIAVTNEKGVPIRSKQLREAKLPFGSGQGRPSIRPAGRSHTDTPPRPMLSDEQVFSNMAVGHAIDRQPDGAFRIKAIEVRVSGTA